MAIIQDTRVIQPNQLDNAIRDQEQGLGDSPANHSQDYLDAEADVRRCGDFYQGSSAWLRGTGYTTVDLIKSYEYLPRLLAEENDEYLHRLRLTPFINFFAPTVNAIASILSKWELTDALPEISEAEKNFDKCGTSLKSFFLEGDRRAIRDGFVGVLTCYPEVGELLTRADEKAMGLRPYSLLIDRQDLDIHGFDFAPDGTLRIETLVVKRSIPERVGQFTANNTVVYWVYQLEGIDGQIVVTRAVWSEIAQKTATGQGQPQAPSMALSKVVVTEQPKILRDVNGNPLRRIPIVLYSLHDPTPWGCTPPLIGLQQKNRAYYSVYSDRFMTVRKMQPTPVRSWMGTVPDSPQPLIVGGQSVIELPSGGTVGYLQADPASVQPMRDLLDEIKALIIEESLAFIGKGTVQQSATEVALDAAKAEAGLANYAHNKTSAVEQVFSDWAQWLGINGDFGSIDVDLTLVLAPASADLVRTTLDAVGKQLDIVTAEKILKSINYLPKDGTLREPPEPVSMLPSPPLDNVTIEPTQPITEGES